MIELLVCTTQKYTNVHTNQKGLIFRINVVQKYSSMQSLLFYLGILGQNFAHISNNALQRKEAANYFNKERSEAPNYFDTDSRAISVNKGNMIIYFQEENPD